VKRGLVRTCTRPLPLLCLSHRNEDEAGPADEPRLCDADRRQKHHGDGGRYVSRSKIRMSLAEAAKRFNPCKA